MMKAQSRGLYPRNGWDLLVELEEEHVARAEKLAVAAGVILECL
jgi:hypothetical protein